jgi:hypothetical protein
MFRRSGCRFADKNMRKQKIEIPRGRADAIAERRAP